MERTTVKDMFQGIALSLVAAYFYPVVLFICLTGPSGIMVIFSGLPLNFLLYTFWLVIPLGASLGILIPRIAYNKTSLAAALHGAGFGALAGLIIIAFTAAVIRIEPEAVVLIVTSVVSYCAVVTGAYAYILAKGYSLYR